MTSYGSRYPYLDQGDPCRAPCTGKFSNDTVVLDYCILDIFYPFSPLMHISSEGKDLTHDDRRSYLGKIIVEDDHIQVHGSVVIGTDLGSDARPEPVARFSLKERADKDDSFTQGAFE